jgi:hypothetical protein
VTAPTIEFTVAPPVALELSVMSPTLETAAGLNPSVQVTTVTQTIEAQTPTSVTTLEVPTPSVPDIYVLNGTTPIFVGDTPPPMPAVNDLWADTS